MVDLQSIIDKVKGKKAVKVKEHHRRQDNKDVVVEAYTKLIDKDDEVLLEDTDEEQPESESEYEDDDIDNLDRLDNLDDPDESDLDMEEPPSEDDEEVIIDTNIETSALEKSILPKLKDEEVNGLIDRIHKTNSEEDWMQLFNKYTGILYFHANKYKTSNIPYNLILLQTKALMVKAVLTFNTKRGVKFNTHLTNYLKKLYRFVNENANIAKIPEQRVRKIKQYNWAYSKLEAKLGRTPVDVELSDELSWPVKEVVRLKDELSRNEVINFGTDYSYGDLGINSSKIDSVIKLVYLDATPDEKFILEHITNVRNKKQLNVKELSKQLKLPENKVKYLISNIKKKIVENA